MGARFAEGVRDAGSDGVFKAAPEGSMDVERGKAEGALGMGVEAESAQAYKSISPRFLPSSIQDLYLI